MKLRTLIALLTALVMLLSVCVVSLAEDDDFEYEDGDPQHMPEFMLRSNPDAGWDWTYAFEHGGVAEILSVYYPMESMQGHHLPDAFEGEGGYTLLRIDGMRAGADTATFVCTSEEAPIKRLTVAFTVDEDWTVRVLTVATDDVVPPPAVLTPSPICPKLLLASNPTTGYNWNPDDSYTPALKAESEYIPSENDQQLVGAGGVESITLVGTDFDLETIRFAYAQSWQSDDPIVTLCLELLCWDTSEVEIECLYLMW